MHRRTAVCGLAALGFAAAWPARARLGIPARLLVHADGGTTVFAAYAAQ
jgi:hypothetical protein